MSHQKKLRAPIWSWGINSTTWRIQEEVTVTGYSECGPWTWALTSQALESRSSPLCPPQSYLINLTKSLPRWFAQCKNSVTRFYGIFVAQTELEWTSSWRCMGHLGTMLMCAGRARLVFLGLDWKVLMSCQGVGRVSVCQREVHTCAGAAQAKTQSSCDLQKNENQRQWHIPSNGSSKWSEHQNKSGFKTKKLHSLSWG